MSIEMERQLESVKLAQAENARMCKKSSGIFDKQIASLEQQIEAEKKPKLRHLDYGCDEDGRSRIMILHNDRLGSAGELALSSCSGACTKCDNLHVNYGNLADDLKALQEDVIEGEISFKCSSFINSEDCINITFDGDAVWISQKGGTTRVKLSTEDLADLILSLRQRHATIVRKEANK